MKEPSPEARAGARRLLAPLRRLKRACLGRRSLSKPYSGSIFDRIAGLDPLWELCPGATVLDFGCCDGLIGYELARHGAGLIHGLDIDKPRVEFARRLFENVPAVSRFEVADLAVSPSGLRKRYEEMLLPRYDIVLFLGMYHHLEKQMAPSDLAGLVGFLADIAGTALAVRSDRLPVFESIILEGGFQVFCTRESPPAAAGVGLLRLYRRNVGGGSTRRRPESYRPSGHGSPSHLAAGGAGSLC